jgi:hypothetical protein
MDPEDAYRAYVLDDGAFRLQERSELSMSQPLTEDIA